MTNWVTERSLFLRCARGLAELSDKPAAASAAAHRKGFTLEATKQEPFHGRATHFASSMAASTFPSRIARLCAAWSDSFWWGVGNGECGDRFVEHVALAQVTADQRRLAGARM